MPSEDDRYRPPTHTCNFCSRIFSVTFEGSDEDEILSFDLSDGRDAVRAAAQGCAFFRSVLYPRWPDSEGVRIKLDMHPESDTPTWEDNDPCYLLCEPRLQGPGLSHKMRGAHDIWRDRFEPLEESDRKTYHPEKIFAYPDAGTLYC
jgi:hypothetical protein